MLAETYDSGLAARFGGHTKGPRDAEQGLEAQEQWLASQQAFGCDGRGTIIQDWKWEKATVRRRLRTRPEGRRDGAGKRGAIPKSRKVGRELLRRTAGQRLPKAPASSAKCPGGVCLQPKGHQCPLPCSWRSVPQAQWWWLLLA